MSYVGCLVSLNCGDVLGTYQGQVRAVDHSAQSISICQPFQNGIKCEVPEVTISACDIKEIKIIKNAVEATKALPKNATPSKLSKETEEELVNTVSTGSIAEAKTDTQSSDLNGLSCSSRDRYEKRHTPCKDKLYSDGMNGHEILLRCTPTKERERDGGGLSHRCYSVSSSTMQSPREENHRSRRNSASEGRNSQRASVPRKIEFKNRKQARQDCFSAPVDSILDDFDFEKNLALFDKKAVYEEIESGSPDSVFVTEKKMTKYRCDENVLQSKPVTFQQIKVPKDYGVSYATDTGLVVPSIDYDLRNKLFDIGEACGFSAERRLEMIGRSAAEMVLQLLGGGSRLNPQNGHQLPTVLVLCGPHIQGAQGMNCARHLVNHGVKTVVFLPNFLRMVQCVEQELKMFEMCGGKRYSHDKDFPTGAVDMIINCLDSHENSFLRDQAWYKSHVSWVSHCRAPVFSIDPPIETTDIVPKWCLYPVLPLVRSDMTPHIYLCDLGLPRKVFKDAGITYRSPFGHKFVIPLHPNT